MWNAALLVFASLAPAAQAGELQITDIRATYGALGPIRQEGAVLPGDNVVFSFEIEGLKADESGKAVYQMTTEINDAQGKLLFRQPARDLETYLSLGGSSTSAFAQVDVGLSAPAGEYQVAVGVTDSTTKKTAKFTRTVKVMPAAFGVVRVNTTVDPQGQLPASGCGVGQTVWINFSAVGYERDAEKHPNVTFTLQINDADGKPVVAKPLTGDVNTEVTPGAAAVSGQFLITLNRAGKFTLALKAVDNITKKTSTATFPLNVHASH